jgi:hypothetical protein
LIDVHLLKESVKKGLKHPFTRSGFDAEGNARWPLDGFTRRRIRDCRPSALVGQNELIA